MTHRTRAGSLGSLLLLALLALGSGSAQARSPASSGALGLGVGAGTRATGLSIKTVRGDTGIQVVAGWWRGGGADYGISFDGLYEIGPLASGDLLELGLAVGVGAGIGFGGRLEATAAPVAGLEINMVALPFDIVLEYRPLLDILPTIQFVPVNFGGHIRFYF